MNIRGASEHEITVSNSAELLEAYQELKAGSGGTILLLDTATYDLKSFDSLNEIDSAVTIKSADSNNPATINSLRLTGAENLTIEDVHIHMDGDPNSFDDIALRISSSTDIVIRDSMMTSDASAPVGTVDTPDAAAQLALVRNSTDITFEGNVISGFNHGLTFMDSHGIDISNNEMSAMQGDGIRIAGVNGLLIEGNHLYDFLGATQEANHSDMIQFWGINTSINTENVVIRENFLDTGNGANYQMIFGHNDAFEDNGFIFDDILIEGNVLFGAHANAIYLGDTNNVTVSHNTVIHNSDAYDILADGTEVASTLNNRIDIDGTNTVIENNITQLINDEINNTVLTTTSPYVSDDYRSHFVNVEAGGSGDLRDLMLLPDSELNGTFGSWLTWSRDTSDTLTAVATVTIADHDRSEFTLSAELSHGPDGYVVDQGATFTWIFDDGNVLEGASVTYDFDTAGEHSYDLIVTMPNGTTDEITRTIEIEDPISIIVEFNENEIVNTSFDTGDAQLLGDAEIEDSWLTIGGRDRLEISRSTTSLFSLNDFNIGITADVELGSAGSLLQLPRTFQVTINEDGSVHTTLTTQDGTFELVSNTAVFADGDAHELNFIFDGDAQSLSLVVDGQIDATVPASGTTAAPSFWGLTIGSTWNDSVDARVQDIYVLNENIPLEEAIPASSEDSTGALENEIDTIISLDFEGGEIIDTSEHGAAITQIGTGTSLVNDTAQNGQVATISDETAISVSRNYEEIFELDSFAFDFDMRSTTENGRAVFRIHESFRLDVVDDDLRFMLTTTEGDFVIETSGDLLEGHDWHNVQINYSNDLDQLQMFVDGVDVASTTASGTTLERAYWGLDIGNRWGNGFNGEIDDFTMLTNIGQEYFDPA